VGSSHRFSNATCGRVHSTKSRLEDLNFSPSLNFTWRKPGSGFLVNHYIYQFQILFQEQFSKCVGIKVHWSMDNFVHFVRVPLTSRIFCGSVRYAIRKTLETQEKRSRTDSERNCIRSSLTDTSAACHTTSSESQSHPAVTNQSAIIVPKSIQSESTSSKWERESPSAVNASGQSEGR